RLAEGSVRRTHAVPLGRVEAVDAEVERPPYRPGKPLGLDAPVAAADLPAAEADGRNVEAGLPERPVLHRGPSSCCARATVADFDSDVSFRNRSQLGRQAVLPPSMGMIAPVM